jgi:hypothetical protein
MRRDAESSSWRLSYGTHRVPIRSAKEQEIADAQQIIDELNA